MESIKIPIKGSFDHRMISGYAKIIGDPFLYQVKSEKQFKHLLHHMLNVIEDLISDSILIESLYDCQTTIIYDVLVTLHMIFDRQKIFKQTCEKSMETNDLRILKLFAETLESQCNDAECDAIRNQLINPIYNQIILEAKRIIINKYVTKHTFIVVDKFDQTMLYHLNKNIMGFITNSRVNHKDETIAWAYDVPVICTNFIFNDNDYMTLVGKHHQLIMYHDIKKGIKQHALKPTKLEMHRKLVDLYNLSTTELNLYHGVYVESEYMIITKGLMANKREVYEDFAKLFELMDKDDHVYLKLPQFTAEKALMIAPNFRTEVHRFSILHEGIMNWLFGVTEAVKKYKPNLTLIIPNLNSADNLLFWEEEIDIFKSLIGNDMAIDMGILIETEAALQYCDDFTDIDVAIFNLDALIEEYTDDKQQVDTKFLMEDLRSAHHIYRVKQPTKHLVTGAKPNMIQKFINRGFRNFIIENKDREESSKIFESWELSRGKFKKSV